MVYVTETGGGAAFFQPLAASAGAGRGLQTPTPAGDRPGDTRVDLQSLRDTHAWRRRVGPWLGLLLAMLCCGCAYRGRDDALSQRFTWFSYLNGDDIRAKCTPGATDRYRFVYNGVYIRQARAYDIVPTETAGAYRLTARVLGPSDLSDVVIENPITTLTQDPLDLLAPFAGTKSTLGLSGRDIDVLDVALTESGFFQPAPKGLYLRSEEFFWVGVACVGGRIAFDAWRYPSPRFDALTFPRLLFSWDQTGIPVEPPRILSPFEIYGQTNPEGKYPQFNLTVGDDGFAGVGTVF